MKKIKILKIFYFILSLLIIYTSIYIKHRFYDVSFEQLLFTIQKSEGTSLSAILEGILFVIAAIVITIIFVIIIKHYIEKITNKFSSKFVIEINNKKIKYVLLPFTNRQKRIYCVLFFILSLFFSSYYLNIFEYLESQRNVSTIFEDYYVDAHDVKITFPNKKRNLIYIYVESLETTNFSKANGGLMEESYIPNLERISMENISFTNGNKIGAYALSGTTWTAAAIIAQTAAVPLKVNVNFNGNQYTGYGESLPGVYNLGDILEDNGYKNYMLMGSDSSFGGRKDYLTYHGNYTIYDYKWAIEQELIPNNYFVWWGYEDSKLFSYAQNKLLEISKKEEPFNFTMLTADTHFMDGYLDHNCPNKFPLQYANSFYCADMMISDFIDWIKKQDFYENTTIIISGDHLTMQEKFYHEPADYNRLVYNTFINPYNKEINTNRMYTTMDIFPTTLASLGIAIEGNRLGLGTNLFSDRKTLVEELGVNKLNNELAKRSNFYNHKLLGNSYYEMERDAKENNY